MFNLPPLTLVVLIGLPTMWVLYTLAFLWVSRAWVNDDPELDR